MAQKLMSRKFWMAAAAFLASLGTGLAGFFAGNETLTAIGGVCCVLSAAIYAGCEAYVDGKAAESNQTITEKQEVVETTTTQSTALNASTTNAATVDKLIASPTVDDLKVGGTS